MFCCTKNVERWSDIVKLSDEGWCDIQKLKFTETSYVFIFTFRIRVYEKLIFFSIRRRRWKQFRRERWSENIFPFFKQEVKRNKRYHFHFSHTSLWQCTISFRYDDAVGNNSGARDEVKQFFHFQVRILWYSKIGKF